MDLKQREAADLWRREEQEKRDQEESRDKAYYLYKGLRDIGDTGSDELDQMINEIKKIADKIEHHRLLNA